MLNSEPAPPVAQTKCRCGHSLAAHETGPCIGINAADCTCGPRTRCGCHELHEVGSGLREGALDAFAETAVSDEQEELPL